MQCKTRSKLYTLPTWWGSCARVELPKYFSRFQRILNSLELFIFRSILDFEKVLSWGGGQRILLHFFFVKNSIFTVFNHKTVSKTLSSIEKTLICCKMHIWSGKLYNVIDTRWLVERESIYYQYSLCHLKVLAACCCRVS